VTNEELQEMQQELGDLMNKAMKQAEAVPEAFVNMMAPVRAASECFQVLALLEIARRLKDERD